MTAEPNGNGSNRFTLARLSENTLFSYGVVLGIIGFTSWITMIYYSTEANRKANAEFRETLSKLATKAEVELIVKSAVNEALLGVYTELGEIKGRLRGVEDRKGE